MRLQIREEQLQETASINDTIVREKKLFSKRSIPQEHRAIQLNTKTNRSAPLFSPSWFQQIAVRSSIAPQSTFWWL